MSKAKELLDMIEHKNKEKNRIKNEARTPEVGIIYFINGELYIDGTPVREAEHYGDFLIHSKDHYTYWEEELSSNNSPIRLLAKGKDYDYYPRGRVVYNTVEDRFSIYLDKCIIDNVKQIISLMHLPKAKSEILKDRHYQCSRCNKDYVE
jgi:hypothetical protein